MGRAGPTDERGTQSPHRLATETAAAPVAYLNGPRAPFVDAFAPWLLCSSRQAASSMTIDMGEEMTKAGLWPRIDKAGLAKSSTCEGMLINAQNPLDGLIRRWTRRGLPATEVPRRLYPLSHFLTSQPGTAETETHTLVQDRSGAACLAQLHVTQSHQGCLTMRSNERVSFRVIYQRRCPLGWSSHWYWMGSVR